MNRLIALTLVSLLLLAATAAFAQEPQPAPKEEQAEDPGIPADFNAYLKKTYPGLDPGGKHDPFNLKDPKDKAERHDYTVAMTQLLLEYMGTLDMGSTISKLFDQYSRGKVGNTVTFKVLHALVLMYYPPGQPNITEAEKLLREAAERAPDYAYPWFLLAQFEYLRFVEIENTSPRAVLQAVDKALEIKPDFLRAVLLKGQVYMRANPPRSTEVQAMLAPFVKDQLTGNPDDFEDLLRLYVSCHGADALYSLCRNLAESGRLDTSLKVRALRVQTTVRMANGQWDDSIGLLEELLKLQSAEVDPAIAAWGHERLARCWTLKAMDLKVGDPELAKPGSKEKFDSFIAEADAQHRACADIEREHMPLALRGSYARSYAEFLTKGLGKLEAARDWLKEYLRTTDLVKSQRTILDNQLRLIELQLDPTEEGLISFYESRVAADEMDELAISLALAREKVRLEGQHFKLQRSLKFFLSQLDNRQRLTSAYAAWLAADTARQIGDGATAQAGKDIATRIEKETELNSQAQADLLASLSEALVLVDHRESQERGIRQCAKLIEAGRENRDIRKLMKDVVDTWADEAFRKGLKNPPDAPSRRDLFSPDTVVAWLNKLADAVKAERTAE